MTRGCCRTSSSHTSRIDACIYAPRGGEREESKSRVISTCPAPRKAPTVRLIHFEVSRERARGAHGLFGERALYSIERERERRKRHRYVRVCKMGGGGDRTYTCRTMQKEDGERKHANHFSVGPECVLYYRRHAEGIYSLSLVRLCVCIYAG